MHTSKREGELWGARARDWVDVQEAAVLALYEAVLTETAVGPRTRLLDVGCGAGGFCRLASARGARITGIDASEALLAIARERVPDGDFRVGEMEALPFAADEFDLVTGFNSFQYAGDPVKALAEAGRVAKPGAAVSIAVWGPPEVIEAAAVLGAIGPLMPPAPPGAPGPFALSSEAALEDLARRAGLTPLRHGAADCRWSYPDEATALRGLLSSGPSAIAIATSGEAAVRKAVGQALAAFTKADGRIEMNNRFIYLIATA